MAKPLVEVAITANGTVFVREAEKVVDASKKIEKQTKASADSASDMGDKISGAARKAGAALGVAAAAAAAAGAAMIKMGLESGDALAKAADKIGVTTESLARLQYAAKLAGVEQSQLDTGLKRLARSLIDAEAGSKTAAQAFSVLGLSTSSLLKLSPDQQFARISDALNKVENSSQRAAVAQQIFGRAGVEILNLAKEGSAGLAKYAREADLLGLSLSRVEAKQIEEAGDAIERLHESVRGLSQQLAVNFAPLLQTIAERMLGVSTASGGMRIVAEQAFNSVTNAAALFVDVLQRIELGWAGVQLGTTEALAVFVKYWQMIKHPFDTLINGFGEFAGALDAQAAGLRQRVAELQAQEPASVAFLNRLRDIGRQSEAAARAATEAGATGTAAFTEMASSADKASKKVDAIAKSTADLADRMSSFLSGIQASNVAMTMTERDRARFNAQLKASEFYVQLTDRLADAKKALAGATAAESAQIQTQIDTLQTAVDGFQAYAVAVDDATMRQFDAAERMKATTEAVKSQAETVDPWAQAMTGAVERVDAAFADMWKNVGDGFDSFAKGLKSAFKDLLAELAHMAITRPIVMSIAGALGMGGASSAFGSTGGASGFGLSSIGSLFNIGSGISKFASGFANGGGISGGINAAFGGGGSLGSMLSSGGAQFYGALSDIGGALGIESLKNAGFNQMTNFMEGSFGANLANIGTNMLAGWAGGKVGNFIGSNVLTDGRQAQNAYGQMVGGAVGSAFGPIGSAVGAAIGSLVDVAFGTDDTKRIRLGITAGQYNTPSNLTESLRGSSGLLLQSEHNRTDDAGEAAKAMMQAFLAIDDSLTVIARGAGATVDLSSARLTNPQYLNNNHVQAGFFGTALNNEMDPNALKNATRDFINSWLNEIKDQLPERVRAVMGAASKKTAEELLAIFGAVVDIDKMLSLDVLEVVAEKATAASRSILDVYRDATDNVLTLAGEYDGTAESLTALTAALSEQKTVAAALADQYQQLGELVNASFASSIAQIEESLLSVEQLYGVRRDQIAEMTAELAATIDPARIAELTSQINAAALSAWNILDETQRATLGQEFVGFLSQARDIASGQVAAGQGALASTEASTASTVDAQLMNSAAVMQQNAASEFSEAVRSFVGAVSGINFTLPGFVYEVNR